MANHNKNNKNNDENVNKKRKVRFNERPTQVVEVENATEEEREVIWYTSKDLIILRQSCTPEETTNDDRSLLRRDFVQNFLAQQSQHQQMGISDPKGLYQFSKACSKESKKRALQVAKNTAKEVLFSKQDLLNCIDDALDILAL